MCIISYDEFQETHKNQAITLYYELDFLTKRLEEMKFRTAEEIQVSLPYSIVYLTLFTR